MANPGSWNIWHGCRKCSEGCENCYMFYIDSMRGVPEKSSQIARTKDADKPLRKNRDGSYKVPSGFILSVNMTSDTFILEADPWRDEMWGIIRKRSDVIFHILTKRVERIRSCLPDDWGEGYDNVMLNITAENQRAFDERWPIFRDVPAKHKGLNLTPLLGPIDLSPALDSGQIEQVNASGEGYGGRRPCHYEWIEELRDSCRSKRINFTLNMTGSVFVKGGIAQEIHSQSEQARLAFESGLSCFFGRIPFTLRSPADGRILSPDELYKPVYNKNRCFKCPNINLCSGCTDCGSCTNVVIVDEKGDPIVKENCTATLDDFF